MYIKQLFHGTLCYITFITQQNDVIIIVKLLYRATSGSVKFDNEIDPLHSQFSIFPFVFFVVLVMKPLHNFLDVFNFSLGVNLFHFIDFSILLCFFFFRCNQTFIYTFFHALC